MTALKQFCHALNKGKIGKLIESILKCSRLRLVLIIMMKSVNSTHHCTYTSNTTILASKKI